MTQIKVTASQFQPFAKLKHYTAKTMRGTMLLMEDGTIILRTSQDAKKPHCWLCISAKKKEYVGKFYAEFQVRVVRVLNRVELNIAF